MEFSEDCTRMETVSKEELHDKLTEFHYCAIIEKEHSTYQIYCSDCIKNNPNSKKEEKYHLVSGMLLFYDCTIMKFC